MTEDNSAHVDEWYAYKERLQTMEDPKIDSQHSWEEIKRFKINAIEGLLSGKTFDYHKTPGVPYK